MTAASFGGIAKTNRVNSNPAYAAFFGGIANMSRSTGYDRGRGRGRWRLEENPINAFFGGIANWTRNPRRSRSISHGQRYRGSKSTRRE